MHEDYELYEWAWAADVLEKRLGKSIEKITAEDIIGLTEEWKAAVIELDKTLYNDAGKEFADTAQIGYGIDGNEETRRKDFAAVRGTFEEDNFVKEIQQHIDRKTALGDELIGRLKELC